MAKIIGNTTTTPMAIPDWNQMDETKADYIKNKPDVDGQIETKLSELVDSAPETLNTLNELAKALGDDPNFATTVATQLGNKVDKIEGKGLSTNDFTTEEKNKLANLTEDREANVQSDWNQTDDTKSDYIKNKPMVDQTYSAESENAQSGKAVAESIKDVEETANKALNATAPYDGAKINYSIILADDTTHETLQVVRGVNPAVNTVKWDGSTAEPTEGSGTEQDPYIIDTPAKLAHIVKQYNANKHYVITNDFDLSGHEWISSKDLVVTYGATGFSGTINGQGHCIIGLTSNPQTDGQDYYTGLIPKVASGGTLHIENLQVRDANIVGPANQGFASGVLAGYVHRCTEITLINCYTDGLLNGKDGGGWIGGGTPSNRITISKCSTNVNYHVVNYGGAIADSWSDKYFVNNCYVKGKLFGNANFSSNNIVNCFSTEENGRYTTVVSEGAVVEDIGLEDIFVGQHSDHINYSYIPMPKTIYTIPLAQQFINVQLDDGEIIPIMTDDKGYIDIEGLGIFSLIEIVPSVSGGFVYTYSIPLKEVVENKQELNQQLININQQNIAKLFSTATNMKIKVDYYNYETTQEFEVEPNTIYFLRSRENGRCWHSKPDGTDKYARRHVGMAVSELSNGYSRAMALEFEKDPPDYPPEEGAYFSIWSMYAITPDYKRVLGFNATPEAPVVVLKIYNENINI